MPIKQYAVCSMCIRVSYVYVWVYPPAASGQWSPTTAQHHTYAQVTYRYVQQHQHKVSCGLDFEVCLKGPVPPNSPVFDL